MSPDEKWDDLRGRLTESLRRLQELVKRGQTNDETFRLTGKIEGVKLALSYMRDYDKENA